METQRQRHTKAEAVVCYQADERLCPGGSGHTEGQTSEGVLWQEQHSETRRRRRHTAEVVIVVVKSWGTSHFGGGRDRRTRSWENEWTIKSIGLRFVWVATAIW